MDLRTAMMVQKVLGLVVGCLLLLSVVTKIKYFLFGAIIVFLAETAVFFLFMKCPHCGRRLMSLSNRYILEKRCPYCGEDLDI